MKELRFIVTNAKDATRMYESVLSLSGTNEVIVKPYAENRRRRQENLYRQYCRIIASATGNDAEMLHKWLARKFLGEERNVLHFDYKGETYTREVTDICSTTKLTVKEMSEYLTQVIAFASSIGINLPTPDDSDA